MVKEKTYYPLSGFYEITDAALAYVDVLMVARSGVVYNETDISTLPTDVGLFYGHNSATGSIQFLIPFESNESINVIYEIP